MTKVLLLAPSGKGVGGILSQTNALLHEWRRDPTFDVRTIDTTQRYRHNHDERVRSRLVGGTVQAIGLALQLTRLLITFNPDIVHIRSSASLGLIRDLVLITLARLARSEVHLSLHFGRIPDLARRSNWEWRLLLLACTMTGHAEVLDRRSAAVLQQACRSCEVAETVNGISCRWVDSIVGPCPRTNTEQQRPRLVFVGNVLAAKGVAELVRACARIDDIEFDLELIGPVGYEMKRELQALAAPRKDGRWLSFAGSVSREAAVEKIASADVFVLPSYSEGFPVSLLEAMACGVAVVATEVGAIPEILAGVEGERAGIIVPPRDCESLALALKQLLADPLARAELGSAARRKCEAEYDIVSVAKWWTRHWVRGFTTVANDGSAASDRSRPVHETRAKDGVTR
jgi:glycosyltransferase involved in cell wall biosynthesis